MKNFIVEFYNEDGKLDHKEDYTTVEKAVDEGRAWEKNHSGKNKLYKIIYSSPACDCVLTKLSAEDM